MRSRCTKTCLRSDSSLSVAFKQLTSEVREYGVNKKVLFFIVRCSWGWVENQLGRLRAWELSNLLSIQSGDMEEIVAIVDFRKFSHWFLKIWRSVKVSIVPLFLQRILIFIKTSNTFDYWTRQDQTVSLVSIRWWEAVLKSCNEFNTAGRVI